MELLTWIVARPRTYEETMAAWRTSCPRHPVWEDALIAGLVEVRSAGGEDTATVSLTASGQALLSSRGDP